MKTDTIFFGTEGTTLTSTSANHIANLAKELVKGHLRDLNGMHFTEKTLNVIGQEAKSVLQYGASEEDLESVNNRLTEIGEANSLIAWLREGIKAKNDFLELVKEATLKDYCEWENKDLETLQVKTPDFQKHMEERGFKAAPERPERETAITESEVVNNWKEEDRLRFEYLKSSIDAITIAIGKFNGIVEELKNFDNDHLETAPGTKGIVVYRKHNTVKLDDVYKTQETLVNMRRGLVNEVNNYRKRIGDTIREDKSAKEEAFVKKLKAYQQQESAYTAAKEEFYNVVMANHKQKVAKQNSDLEAYRIKKAKEVGNMKIVIPTSLKVIYSKVAALGK
ncbi:MAG: hypothetical protein MJZ02_05065 [Paludibacteraceae bacterium]|nr:hypothetical protein [Paludibacteraceae bacterium]